MESDGENAYGPKRDKSQTALKWIAWTIFALGVTSILGSIAIDRMRGAWVRRLIDAKTLVQRIDSLCPDEDARWSGDDPSALTDCVRAVERRLDDGEFPLGSGERQSLDESIGNALCAMGELVRGTARITEALRSKIDWEKGVSSGGDAWAVRWSAQEFEQGLTELRTDRARALLAIGDVDSCLRELFGVLETLESFEADDFDEDRYLSSLLKRHQESLPAAEIHLALGELDLAEHFASKLPSNDLPPDFDAQRAHSLLAEVAERRGDWHAAALERRDALAALGEWSNLNDASFAQRTYELARSLDAGPQSGWDEALTLYERTLLARRRVACGDFEEFAEHLALLGRCLAKTGDAHRARELLEEAHAMKARLFDAHDPRVIAARQDVERIVLMPKALARREAKQRADLAIGLRHDVDTPDRVMELNELGRTLRAAGKTREAERTYVQALEMQQRIVPGDSPGAAPLMNNVGLARAKLGERAEGKALLEQSLAMRKRLFGGEQGDADHEDIVQSLMNLGSWYHAEHDFERTWEFESAAVAMMRRLVTGDDMQLAIAIDNLGSTACDLGRNEESIALHREALAMERRLVPGDDPDVAQTLDDLGVMLYRTDKSQEALVTLNEALHMRRRLFTGDHEKIVTTLIHVGWTEEDLHELRGALESYREALAMQKRLDPSGSVDVIELQAYAAQALSNLGEFGPARAMFAEALELGPRLLPRSEVALADALKGMQMTCERSKSWADSEVIVLAAGGAVHECKGLSRKPRAQSLAAVAAFYRTWNAFEPSSERLERATDWTAKR